MTFSLKLYFKGNNNTEKLKTVYFLDFQMPSTVTLLP